MRSLAASFGAVKSDQSHRLDKLTNVQEPTKYRGREFLNRSSISKRHRIIFEISGVLSFLEDQYTRDHYLTELLNAFYTAFLEYYYYYIIRLI